MNCTSKYTVEQLRDIAASVRAAWPKQDPLVRQRRCSRAADALEACATLLAREQQFREAVEAARRTWLEENPAEDGHDEVTPFDYLLYGVAVQPQALTQGWRDGGEGYWNEEHNIYTAPIDIGTWDARLECHGRNQAEAEALRATVLATPPMVAEPVAQGGSTACGCDPAGSDGLRCPDSNGQPLCTRSSAVPDGWEAFNRTVSWLRGNANAAAGEMREAFIEAHNAAKAIKRYVLATPQATLPRPLETYQALERALQARKCSTCGGLGTCNDVEPGDISYQTWTCPDCAGTGLHPQENPHA